MIFRLSLVFTLVTLIAKGQAVPGCQKAGMLKTALDKEHIAPPTWDDAFGLRIVNLLFSRIDPQGQYFSYDERAIFTAKPSRFSTDLPSGNCSVVKELSTIYKAALTRADKIVTELQSETLNFTTKDTLKVAVHNPDFAVKTDAIKARWRSLIKVDVLNECVNVNGKMDATHIKPAQERACKKQHSVIKRRQNKLPDLDTWMMEEALEAIAVSYDPHTAFLTSLMKELFLQELSTDQLSFGLILDSDAMGRPCIGKLIPGGSAWATQVLHVGDLITELNMSGQEPIDATLYTGEELQSMMNEFAGSDLALSVQTVGGDRLTVDLKKTKLREDENKIKSLVFSNKDYRFGYVNFPIFFSKTPTTKTGCAEDLAKEIIQLKKAGIQGLVLDLRNNGGGDLEEAINLSGIFIDRGALAIIKDKGEEAETLKDANPGTAYDGPLVLMTNSGSASASELFVGAMRAHHRAIVVGSRTYGKSTGQSLLKFGNESEMIKVTTFRFYDVLGHTHQGKGLNPDIEIPEIFDEIISFHESGELYSLPATSISKKTYYTPLPVLPLAELRKLSLARTSTSQYVREIALKRERLVKVINNGFFKVPLTVEGLMTVREIDALATAQVSNHASDRFKVNMTGFDENVSHVDTFGGQNFATLIDKVSKDFTIDECLNILIDYIQLQKK